MFKLLVASIVLASACADHIDHDANIVNYAFDSHPDGHYQYAYETSNGIAGQEQGAGGAAVSGTNQYVAPDGQAVKLAYTADENGYIAQGSHIPPIPEEIIKSLEWNRNHPEEDDYLHPELSGATHAQSVAQAPLYAQQQVVHIRPQQFTHARH